MINGCRGLVLSVLAAVCLAAPALAQEAQKKPAHSGAVVRHHPVQRPATVASTTPLSDDAFLHGTVPDVGSDNRYFTDTRSPSINSLGPTIFSKWQ